MRSAIDAGFRWSAAQKEERKEVLAEFPRRFAGGINSYGCAKENSTILKKHPWAASKWDGIQKEIEETPDDVVIDIPVELSELSAELQSVYSVGPEDQAHVDIPMEVNEINED